jgi:hypothetical protein
MALLEKWQWEALICDKGLEGAIHELLFKHLYFYKPPQNAKEKHHSAYYTDVNNIKNLVKAYDDLGNE